MRCSRSGYLERFRSSCRCTLDRTRLARVQPPTAAGDRAAPCATAGLSRACAAIVVEEPIGRRSGRVLVGRRDRDRVTGRARRCLAPELRAAASEVTANRGRIGIGRRGFQQGLHRVIKS